MQHLKSYIQRVSNEDAATDEAVVVTPEAEVVPVVDEVVEASELVEEAPTADAVNAEIDEVTDIQESLESFGNLLDAAIARGGMRPEEGVMFQTSLEHFQRRLGVAVAKLGLEDFGGNMSRLKATEVSQEALTDVAKEAGKKIQELFAKLVAFIKESIANFKLKSSKVQAILEQSKVEVAKVAKSDKANDPVTIKVERISALTKKDVDEGYTTAIATVKQLTVMLVGLRTSLKAYEMSVKTLLANQDDDNAIAEFTADLEEQWTPCPAILKFVNGTLGKPRVLTHAMSVTYAEEAAFFETDSDPAAKNGFEMEVTAASMGPLGGATYALNRAVDDMVKEYATTAEILTKMLSTRPVATDRETQINLAQSQGDVVNIIKKEVFMVVSDMTRARDHAGYIILQGALGLKMPLVGNK